MGSVLAMLAGLLRAMTHLAGALPSPSGAWSTAGLTALATAVLAGAMLAAVLALVASVAALSRTAAAIPLIRRASGMREKSWRAAFLRQRDPDAAGRSRPRAPSAAPAAALSC
ncbi:MAG TPA: DUF6412 domain-containing protein [Streptosporangiaceae bacterium]